MVETKNLFFVPMDLPLLLAGLNGEKALGKALQASVPAGFIEPVHKERVFPVRQQILLKNPSLAEWYGFVIQKETRTVIGMMGFKDAPDANGSIEIGYGIHPDFQGKGYATEMTRTLFEWAFQKKGVSQITAQVLPANHPSVRILKKLGMTQIREQDGLLVFAIRKEDWRAKKRAFL